MEEKKNLWSSYDEAAKKELHEINEKYKACLDAGKTERECVKLAVEMAKEAGYQDIKDVLKEGKSLKAGDKVYAVCMEKMLAMFRMGEEPLSNGMNILGAHIDSPRIDVKQNPLYESEGMAYLDTHYYGGIKKYQWVTGPMALHGVVAKKDGSVEEISIGEKESDPVFVITDLLVHLAANQMSKKASEVIEGEKLDLLITESAGLCGRCSPHIRDIPAVCVIDCLSGITAPQKIGPMLRYADFIAVTKGDLVSPAEREVFLHNIRLANRKARVSFINGLTGQGAYRLASFIRESAEEETIDGKFLRFTMPSAVCSFCAGQMQLQQKGNGGRIKRMWGEENG